MTAPVIHLDILSDHHACGVRVAPGVHSEANRAAVTCADCLDPTGPPLRILAELDAEPWKAEITQAGRWWYHIRLHKGLTKTTGGWSALGRQRAERKARRLLARRTRADRRSADTITITGGRP